MHQTTNSFNPYDKAVHFTGGRIDIGILDYFMKVFPKTVNIKLRGVNLDEDYDIIKKYPSLRVDILTDRAPVYLFLHQGVCTSSPIFDKSYPQIVKFGLSFFGDIYKSDEWKHDR